MCHKYVNMMLIEIYMQKILTAGMGVIIPTKKLSVSVKEVIVIEAAVSW